MISTGLALVALTWSALRARGGQADESPPVGAAEERVFRRLNAGDHDLDALTWLVMQGGSLTAVGAVAALAAHHRGIRRGALVAATGGAAWVGVKVIKPLVGRGRPDQHLDDVVICGQPQRGLGYPSGHAAVAVALAMSATLPGAARTLSLLGALGVGTSRVRVGAHLPLDVVGGFAVGALIEQLINRWR